MAGCTTHPDNITAASVSEAPYANLSCADLRSQYVRARLALEDITAQQLTARKEDTIGLLVFGAPMARMNGKSQDKEVAEAKGRVEAIRAAAAHKKCDLT